jgi:toluene monooxygenase system ferredoxin subunit
MAFQKVASVEDLWSGEMMGLEVKGQRVLLVNLDGKIYAYADACPHQKSRLSEGGLSENILRCATHHWEFDVSSGSGVNPQNTCLKAFAVALNGADILVDVDGVATSDGALEREPQR